ncbi:MAG: glycosyltransferase family 4 protein [Methanoregulaceae archaeon]|nr:glycosyltransferase family 4 protein [Methanoregulaceae archaeon]
MTRVRNNATTMKIAYVYDAVYPYVVGGVERRLWELARRLVGRGHEVHIYCMKFWEGPEVFVKEGVNIHGICPYARFYHGGTRSVGEAVLFASSCFLPLYRDRFDIVDCQEFPYLHCFTTRIGAFLGGSRFIVTWFEVWKGYWYQYLGYSGFFGNIVEMLLSRLPAIHIAGSETTRLQLLHEHGLRVSAVIPNGIDSDLIRKVLPSAFESDIVFAGRLIKEKNVDLLIRTVAFLRSEIPQIKCVIIGDGPERTRLESLTKDLGIKEAVTFTGFLKDYEEVVGFMKSSKVFVFPSMREGFGNAAIEAMACGLPLVTIDHPRNAARSFVTPDTGSLCTYSPEDFARGIRYCLARRSTMREKCIIQSERFDWSLITDQVEKVYENISRKPIH